MWNLNFTRGVALSWGGGFITLDHLCSEMCRADVRGLHAQRDGSVAGDDDRADTQGQNVYCPHGSSCNATLLNSDSSSLNNAPSFSSITAPRSSAMPSVAVAAIISTHPPPDREVVGTQYRGQVPSLDATARYGWPDCGR